MESRIVITRALFDESLKYSRLKDADPDNLWAFLTKQLTTRYGLDCSIVAICQYLGYAGE